MQLISLPQILVFGNTSAVLGPNSWTLADVPEIPNAQLYKHMIDQGEPTLPIEINRDTENEPSFTLKILAHPWTYMRLLLWFIFLAQGSIALKEFSADLSPKDTNPTPQSHHYMLLWMIM